MRTLISLGGLLASMACGDAFAQSISDDGRASASASASDLTPLNGFASHWHPGAKRRNESRDTGAYAPVKHVDDMGQTPEIDMFVGESRVLPAPGVGRIAVGNGRIMTAAVLDKREILLFANDRGTSSLFIWNEDGRYQRLKINIVPGDTSRIGREIAEFLSSIPGAKASIVGDKVIVEGDRLSEAELAKIKKLEGSYPQIVNFTDAHSWEKMVMMDVKVVEFPKTEMREFGLKWTPAGGGAIGAVWHPITRGNNGPYQVNIPVGTGQSALPITDVGQTGVSLHSALNIRGAIDVGLSATLNALAQEGRAAVLAEPQLSARSGAKAKFLAGGEFPYVISTLTGPVVNFKEYGIKLDIEPVIDRDGYIRARILTEVSSIDASVSTPEGPALKKRSTETEFNVRSGETIVLSGMLTRDNSSNIDKVPYLGDIPVLGALFRSKRYQNNETELVVFVTPTVVDAHTPDMLDRVDKTKQRLEQRLGKAPYLTEPLQPRAELETVVSAPMPSSASAPTPEPLGATRTSRGANLRVLLDGLALRASPDVRSATLMQLGEGSVVQLEGQDAIPAGHWRQVRVGRVVGWVASQGVAPMVNEALSTRRPQALVSGAAKHEDQTPAVRPRYRVILPKLALRVAPDINAAIVAKMPQGALVRPDEGGTQGGWMSVEVDGRHGWVAAQWLEPQL